MLKNKQLYPFILIMIASLIGLLFLIAVGAFIRPGADDLYYTSYDGSQPYYTLYFLNGRITTILLYWILYSLPFGLQIIPLLGISLLLFSFYMLIRAVLSYTLLPKKYTQIVAFSMASLLTLLICALLPGLYVSLYWFAAAPVHTWSVIFSILYVGLTLKYSQKHKPSLLLLFLIFIIGAVAVGCLGEIAMMALGLIGLVTFVTGYICKNKNSLKIGCMLLLSSVLSFIVLFFSPGAISRRQRVEDANTISTLEMVMQLPKVILDNIAMSIEYFEYWYILIFIIAISTLTVKLLPIEPIAPMRKVYKTVFMLICAVIVFNISCISLIWIGLHEPQPLRSYFATTIALVFICVILGVAAGLRIKEFKITKATQLFTILTLIAVAISIPPLYSFGSGVIDRAKAFDERGRYIDNEVRASNCTLPIKALPVKGMWVESSEPTYWVNQSIAIHYKLSCVPHTQNQYESKYVPIG